MNSRRLIIRSPRPHVGIAQDVGLTLQILQTVLDYITDADDTGELAVVIASNLPRPLLQKILRICELPHVGAAKKYASPYRQAQRDIEGMQMRAWIVGIAVVVAIGLIWSFAAMSNLVPVDGSEMSLAGISRPAE